MTGKTRALDPKVYFCALLGLDTTGMLELAAQVLVGAEDGELYFERTLHEGVALDDGRVAAPSFSIEQGVGVRRVNGKSVLYASGNSITKEAIIRAGEELAAIAETHDTYVTSAPSTRDTLFYSGDVKVPALSSRAALLRRIDRAARKDKMVANVTTSLNCVVTYSLIVRADGRMESDVRPMTRLDVAVLCTQGEKTDSFHESLGGRYDHTHVSAPSAWKPLVESAIRHAKDKLRALPCPSGEMPVVLGPGWAGVLLHEAIGHGLEGDFVWQKTTVFADLIGTRVGSPLVNVVDDGTMPEARGSLHVDDEGTPTERTFLIKDGILVGFMHDRQSARLLGLAPTGNGRRESYAHRPQVRMRNTVMLSGDSTPEEIIAKRGWGIYLPAFGGGQVDPATGQFVFRSELAYLITDGKIGHPVVGATLIGNCATALLHVDMVGNDSCLGGAGTCGKGGQSVPVGIGQPTLGFLSGLTIGGTESTQEQGV